MTERIPQIIDTLVSHRLDTHHAVRVLGHPDGQGDGHLSPAVRD